MILRIKLSLVGVFIILFLGASIKEVNSNDTKNDKKLNNFLRTTNGDQNLKQTENSEISKLIDILENPQKLQQVIMILKSQTKELSSEMRLSDDLMGKWGSLYHSVNKDSVIYILKAFLRIVIIIGIYVLLRRLINRFIYYYIQKISYLHKEAQYLNNTVAVIKTITPIVQSTIHAILMVLCGLLVLSELNVNIMPIIYSFSIIGLGISIGSQTLVKDLINGVMTLFEGNMAVGDIVTVGSFKGEVESISLRCVHLRHSTGELQTIPFSEVNYVINHSRDYGVANIEFRVSYQAKLKEVEEALQKTYEEIQKDIIYSSYIKGPLKKLGVSHMGDWGVRVSTSVRTVPDPSRKFLGEFYRLLILELQNLNIPMQIIPIASDDIINLKPHEG